MQWTCSDADNDLDSYDVYLGVSAALQVFRAGVTDTSLPGLVLERNKRYYWKVVAIDKKGNRSTSDIYTFTLN